jgi:hypothetical protein
VISKRKTNLSDIRVLKPTDSTHSFFLIPGIFSKILVAYSLCPAALATTSESAG